MSTANSHKRDGLSAESSVKSLANQRAYAANQRAYAAGMSIGRPTGMNNGQVAGSGSRATSNWAPNNRTGGQSRRSYRQSNMRRSTNSRAGGEVDGFAPIKLIDEQGVNRTPKPLVAIVTSAALRQARGLVTEESVVGSENSEAMFGDLLSSTGFSRGWFNSGTSTPQDGDSEYQGGRMMVPNNAAVGDCSLVPLGGSGMAVGLYSSRASHDTASPSSSARPTGEQAPAATDVAAAAILTESDLAKEKEVLLQETETMFLWQVPGVVVAADSTEGAQVTASNQQYAAQLAARDSSDKFTSSVCQTLVPLMKQREVQSGTSGSSDTGCQASRWDIADTYAAVEKGKEIEAEEQLGSVLPSGQAVATGVQHSGYQSSSQTSFLRNSQQNWGRSSTTTSFAGGSGSHTQAGRRTTNLDSSITAAWGRQSSSMASGPGKKGSGFSGDGSHAAAAAALLAVTAAAPQPDPWTRLEGLAEVLAAMEAAIAQNTYLPQLLLYRDIRPPARPGSALGATGSDDGLSASGSLSVSGASGIGSICNSSHHLAVVPPTPGTHRPSPLPSARGAVTDAWGAGGHTPHGGGSTPNAAGLGAIPGGLTTPGRLSVSTAGGHSQAPLSRRPSQQLPLEACGSRQSSFMSMGSSRLMRSNRPAAGLQLLWTWSCPLTEGLPISSITWNKKNTNLVAAGYRDNGPAAAAQCGGAAGGAAGSRPASQGDAPLQQGGRASTREGLAAGSSGVNGPAAEAAAEVAGGARGRVALWSLKNQFHPVWTFDTKSAVTALDFSQQSPHILAVGLHDGTIAVYDICLKSDTPLMASIAETGKHSDPVWKVRWIDRGPEREELLVSVSTDGKVKAWTIAKGLEHSTLITLKRVPHRIASAGPTSSGNGSAAATTAGGGAVNPAGLPAGSGAKAAAAAATVAAFRSGVGAERDALISRNTGGMSFDFSTVDNRIYLAGTEDGHIHKCSTSYSEQYLETYIGHIGPVYALQWSPFSPNLFISCSGDWTIRLWQQGRQQQLLSFQSSNDEVLDVQWCPSNSTVFGAVTAGGRLELWDFAVSTMRPVVQHVMTKCNMTSLLFAKDAPVVLAANDAGGLLVFRLVNVAADRFEPAELQLNRLEEALRANVMGALTAAG